MQILNFPLYEFRFKNSENKLYIFDIVRKKFVSLTPEEWVRQHTIQFLLKEKKYPQSLMNGLHHIFYQIDYVNQKYVFLEELPDFYK